MVSYSGSDAPEVIDSPALNHQYHHDATLESDQKLASDSSQQNHQQQQSRRCCGLKRKTFLIVLAIVVIAVAALAGGLAGGLASKHSTSSSSSSSSGSSTNSTAPIASGPITLAQRSMAAAVSVGSTAQISHSLVFYQDLATTDIHYTRFTSDKPATEQLLNLTIAPSWGSPLAAVAVNGTANPIVARLFYIAQDKNTTNMVQASLACSQGSCVTLNNTVIPTTASGSIHPDTKIAAIQLSGSFTRVYYQQEGGDIWAFIGNSPSTNDWVSGHIASDANLGTSLTAFGKDSTGLSVVYVSANTTQLRIVHYNDILGPDKGRLPNQAAGCFLWSSVSYFPTPRSTD